MKYVLIGGSGFIGQHFKSLLGENIVLNLDINCGINNSKFEYCDIKQKINIDISKYESISVIHLAAVHFDFQSNYYETNVKGTSNVLDWINKNNNIVNYVFFSSVATYGDSTNGKDESSVQEPYNDYGKSKLDAEKLIINWKKTNLKIKTVIVRPAVVFGEYNFGNVFNLINQINSGIFAIIGDGENIKSIAYAPNLVKSVLFSINNIEDNLFIYNYSDYPQKNIKDQSLLISKICEKNNPIKIPLFLTKLITLPVDFLEKILGKDLKINSMRVKKFTISTYFKSNLIRNRGYKQHYSVSESIKNTVNWINQTKDLQTKKEIVYNYASKL